MPHCDGLSREAGRVQRICSPKAYVALIFGRCFDMICGVFPLRNRAKLRRPPRRLAVCVLADGRPDRPDRRRYAAGGTFCNFRQSAEDRGSGLTPVNSPGSCCGVAQIVAGPGVKNSHQDRGRRTISSRSIPKHLGEQSPPECGGRAQAKLSSALHLSQPTRAHGVAVTLVVLAELPNKPLARMRK